MVGPGDAGTSSGDTPGSDLIGREPIEGEPIERGLGIAEVSRVLGVPIPTLRSWELRYSVPRLARGTGQHRRYRYDQLHALRLMRDEISRGLRAGDAARSVQAQLDASGPARSFVNRFLDASARADAGEIRAVLEAACAALGLALCMDDMVLPAMRQVGVWWQTGRCEVTEEHLVSDVTRRWIGAVAAAAPPPGRPEPILFACGPADLHTIGLEALAALLRYERRATRVLGAKVPTTRLLATAASTDAAAVVIVSHLATGRQRAIESMRALEAHGRSVFYGGNSFAAGRSRDQLPGVFLGETLTSARDTIERWFARGGPPAALGSDLKGKSA